MEQQGAENCQQLLLFACTTGDLDAGAQALQAGANVDFNPAEAYATPLYLAAYGGHKNMIDFLLSRNARVEAVDQEGRGPLHMAAYQGHVEAVQALLVHRPLLNATSKDGSTPLALAARFGRTEVVEVLLSQHACISMEDKDGRMPLLRAAEGGHRQVVRLLLEAAVPPPPGPAAAVQQQQQHGAGAAAADDSDEDEEMVHEDDELPVPHGPLAWGPQGNQMNRGTAPVWSIPRLSAGSLGHALRAAERLGLHDEMALMLHEAAQLQSYKRSSLLLFAAAYIGDVALLELLLDLPDPQVDTVGEGGWSPLHVAAYRGHTGAAQFLLQRGANMEAATQRGETPLLCAARAGASPMLEMLHGRGANMEAMAMGGYNALHLAVEEGRADAVQLLMHLGLRINVRTQRGNSVIHTAVATGQADMLPLLVGAGADLEARNQYNATPLFAAIAAKQWECVVALVARGARCDADNDKWMMGWQHTFLDLLPVAVMREGKSMQVRSAVAALLKAAQHYNGKAGGGAAAPAKRRQIPKGTRLGEAAGAGPSSSTASPSQSGPPHAEASISPRGGGGSMSPQGGGASNSPRGGVPTVPVAALSPADRQRLLQRQDMEYLASSCAGRVRAVDPAQRPCQLQVRSENGRQCHLLQLDAGHTIRDVRACLNGLPSRVDADPGYLLRCPFPPRLLRDEDETLAAAGMVPNGTLLMQPGQA